MKKQIIYLSPSSINLYLVCPLLYKNKSLKLNNDKILNYGSWIHKCIEDYLKSDKKKNLLFIAKNTFIKYNIDLDAYLDGQALLKRFLEREYLKYPILDTEQEFSEILSNGVAIKGRIDAIVERDADTIEIIDFKSGWKFYSIVLLNKSIQLKIYKNLVSSKSKYKKYKNILLTIDPLRYDPLSIIQDDMDNNLFLDWMSEMYFKIISDTKCEPNYPNDFCKSCSITNMCEPYKNFINYNFELKKTIDEKARDFFELQKIRKIVDANYEFYKDFFENYIIKNTTKNFIKIGKYDLTLQNKRVIINKKL